MVASAVGHGMQALQQRLRRRSRSERRAQRQRSHGPIRPRRPPACSRLSAFGWSGKPRVISRRASGCDAAQRSVGVRGPAAKNQAFRGPRHSVGDDLFEERLRSLRASCKACIVSLQPRLRVQWPFIRAESNATSRSMRVHALHTSSHVASRIDGTIPLRS